MTIYNHAVLTAAEKVARAVQQDFFKIRNEGAVTLSAIAGGGKSHLVMETVKECRKRGIRVAVAAPTNEQVFGLVKSIAENEPQQTLAYVPARDVELPMWAQRPNVNVISPAHRAS